MGCATSQPAVADALALQQQLPVVSRSCYGAAAGSCSLNTTSFPHMQKPHMRTTYGLHEEQDQQPLQQELPANPVRMFSPLKQEQHLHDVVIMHTPSGAPWASALADELECAQKWSIWRPSEKDRSFHRQEGAAIMQSQIWHATQRCMVGIYHAPQCMQRAPHPPMVQCACRVSSNAAEIRPVAETPRSGPALTADQVAAALRSSSLGAILLLSAGAHRCYESTMLHCLLCCPCCIMHSGCRDQPVVKFTLT
jgi:hypothetical protein